MDSLNWAGNHRYRAAALKSPTTIAELQDAVAGAGRVKALGTRHAFSDLADTSELQLSVAALPTRFDIDEDARTVTVSAGARYGDFVRHLHDAGWAVHNLASLPHISVAGAIATGTHGSGDRNGTLSSAVAALDLVTADGEQVTVRRGDPDFDGIVVSLGALGIVTSVSLDIEPTFDVRQDSFHGLGWHELERHFDEITSAAYSVSLFTDWGEFGAREVLLKSRMDGDTAAANRPRFFGAAAPEHVPDAPGSSGNMTQQGGVPGPWWNRVAHFKLDLTPSNGDELQTEYLVPREHALGAIAAIRELQPLIGPHLRISEIRTMAADHLWLSGAYETDAVGIHFTWKKEDAVYGLLPTIDSAFALFAARPHWAKVFETDPAILESLYPRLGDFRALTARLDPDGKFRNDFLDRTIFGA